ncbi:MAG TPA: SurA N-terminal domain-containing protein [Bryocella sp.]|nr:SurA N-terminal domain-containing protein [Bryocella sp.]
MRRIFSFTIGFALLLTAAVLPAAAGEVLDGVVASVNRHPILRSDWDEAVRFEAFMQQRPVSQMTETDRIRALQRLIDRQLLSAQMGDANYMRPSEEKLQQDVAKLRAQVPNGNDDEAWRRLLASYGLNEASLKQHLATEVQVMDFIEVRLRPSVHINADEIEAYYKNQLIPDLKQNGGKVVPLDEVKPRIQELLTEQHIDELLDAWLHNLRQQADIRSTVAIPGVNAPEAGDRAAGVN